MFGLGMMIGPFIGGLLYEVDGFYFPFVICGGSLLICALISCFFVKSIPSEDGSIAEDETTKSVEFKQLLKIPSISICCFLLINAQMSVTWYMVSIRYLRFSARYFVPSSSTDISISNSLVITLDTSKY